MREKIEVCKKLFVFAQLAPRLGTRRTPKIAQENQNPRKNPLRKFCPVKGEAIALKRKQAVLKKAFADSMSPQYRNISPEESSDSMTERAFGWVVHQTA